MEVMLGINGQGALQSRPLVKGMLGIHGQWALQYRIMVEDVLGINGQCALQYRQMMEGMLGTNGFFLTVLLNKQGVCSYVHNKKKLTTTLSWHCNKVIFLSN